MNNDSRVWISLCSCAAPGRTQIRPGTRLRSIPEHGSSGCHRNKAAVFIFGVGQWFLDTPPNPTQPNPPPPGPRPLPLYTFTTFLLSGDCNKCPPPPKGGLPGAHAQHRRRRAPPPPPRPPLSFAVPSAISSSHSSPASRRNKERAEPRRAEAGVMKKKAPLGH